MAERSRRTKGNVDKLAEYKRAREGGARKWKPEEDVALYDEVTEDQYRSIVKGRLQRDDFVVDDGVSGYMDNGMDDWTGQDDADAEDDEEEDLRSRKSSKKKATGASTKAKVKPRVPPPAAKPSISAYRPAVSEEQEEDFMANLLGGIDTAPIPAPVRSKKRKPSPVLDYDDPIPDRSSSPVPYRKNNDTYNGYSSDGAADDGPSSNPPSSDFEDYTSMMSPKKKARVANGTSVVTPAIERMGKLEVGSGSEDAFDASMDFSDIDMNDFMDLDDIDVKPSVPAKKELSTVKIDSKPVLNSANTPKKENLTAPSWLSVYDSLAVVSEDTLGSKPAFSSKTSVNALEDDGSLHMFWLDHLEHGGKLYLIGKVKDKTSDTWASACLSIQGIQRNLFVLPRPLRVVQDETEDGQVEMVETDVVPEKGDVYSDFERIRREIGIKSWKARWVTRKYAFDYKEIPKETEWMKVVYSYEGE
ncbi:putative DNA polymerase alpha subunit [Lanmaoa asiatica]|nr:putative DNA polymerase alpha subunit [Lanmaoa asiatica]